MALGSDHLDYDSYDGETTAVLFVTDLVLSCRRLYWSVMQDETEAAVAVAMFNGQQIFPGSARPLQCKQGPQLFPKIKVWISIAHSCFTLSLTQVCK